jgi:hypothetical protein
MDNLVRVEKNKSVDWIRHLNYMRDCQRVRSKELCYRRIFYVLFLCVLAASALINYRNLYL